MRDTARIKTAGYLVSSVSVVLLALPSLKSSRNDPVIFWCIVIGGLLSIAGMALRWYSYRDEQHQDTDSSRP